MLNKKEKIKLAKILMDNFNTGDWQELLTITNNEDYFSLHPNFTKDITWKNDGLKAGCIEAVEVILANPDNLEEIWEFDHVQHYLTRNDSSLYDEIKSIIENDSQRIVTQPDLKLSNETVYSALDDAERTVNEGKPQNAVDRVHTAVQGHLRHICKEQDISHVEKDTIAGLSSKLRQHYKDSKDVSNNDPIIQVLNGITSIFEGMNTLRNRASLSHSENKLLDKHEALLVINISRSLMAYLDIEFS